MISLWWSVDLALPERALLRSPLGSRTQVHSPRFSLAKPARLCDITAYGQNWSVCRLSATRVVVMCAACAAYVFRRGRSGLECVSPDGDQSSGEVRRLRGL